MARLLERHRDAIVALQREGVTRARIREALAGRRPLPGLDGISADDPVRISNAELARLRRTRALPFEIGGRRMTRNQAVSLANVVGRTDLTRAQQVQEVRATGLRVSEAFIRGLARDPSSDLRRRPIQRAVPRDFTGARYLYEALGRTTGGDLVPIRFSSDVRLTRAEVDEQMAERLMPFESTSKPPEGLADTGGGPRPGRTQLLAVTENVGGPYS